MENLDALYSTQDNLYKQKQEIEIAIEAIEAQINKIICENQKLCSHQIVHCHKDYDGHTWKYEYKCQFCNKKLNCVGKEQTVINFKIDGRNLN